MSSEALKKQFFELAEKGDHEKIVALFQKGGKDLINARNEEGNTALHIAVKNRKKRATRLFCNIKEMDVNAENKDKNTALHFASVALAEKDAKLLGFLLQRKEINTIHFNSVNVTPIHLAVVGNKEKMFKAMCNHLQQSYRNKMTPESQIKKFLFIKTGKELKTIQELVTAMKWDFDLFKYFEVDPSKPPTSFEDKFDEKHIGDQDSDDVDIEGERPDPGSKEETTESGGKRVTKELNYEYLTDVLKCIESFEAGGKRRSINEMQQHVMDTLNRLTEFSFSNNIPVSSFFLIVGNQSAGKTTLINSLTQQTSFLVDAHTGTKARTLVTSSYNPALKGDKNPQTNTKISFKYACPEKKLVVDKQGLSTMDMFKEHEKAFGKQSFGENDFDTINDAFVKIEIGRPNVGLAIVDHPGIIVKSVEKTIEITQKSINEFYTSKSPEINGVEINQKPTVLIAHSLSGAGADEAGIIRIDNFDKIDGEDIVFVYTKCDTFSHSLSANRIRKYLNKESMPSFLQGRNIERKDAEGRATFELSTLDILKLLEWETRQAIPQLREESKVFFVSSCSATLEDLTEKYREGRDTFEYFLNDPNKGEKANHDRFIKKMNDASSWQKEGIFLRKMTKEEEEEYDNYVGTKPLFDFCLRKQYKNALEICDNVCRLVDIDIDRVSELRNKNLRLANSSQSLHVGLTEFLNEFINFFGLYSASEPYQGKNRQGTNYSKILCTLQDTLGWSLKEELELYRQTKKRVTFPPKKFRIGEFNKYIQYVGEFVQPITKIFNIRSLIKRFEEEYFFLLEGITIKPIHHSMLKRTHLNAQTAIATFDESVLSECFEAYNGIFKDETGGNGFVAGRIALNFLMYTQAVLDIMFMNEKFLSIVDDPQKEFKERFLLLDKQVFEEYCFREKYPDNDTRRPNNFLSESISKIVPRVVRKSEFKKRDLKDDLKRLLCAMYFDQPYEIILADLEHFTTSLTRTQPSYLSTNYTFSTLFLHNDPEFLKLYAENFNNVYANKFLREKEESGSGDKNENRKFITDLSQPHRFEFFSKLSKKNADICKQMHNIDLMRGKGGEGALEHSKIKANFSISLLCLQQTPDHLSRPESSIGISTFYHQHLNYVKKRYITTYIFETKNQTYRIIESMFYQFFHGSRKNAYFEEMIERYSSILLGYDYPFKERERPQSQYYKDPNEIVPFMFGFMDYFAGRSPGTDEHCMTKCALFVKSPLFQALLSLQGYAREEAITRLYQKYQYEVNKESKHYFHIEIFHTLCRTLYNDADKSELYKQEAHKKEEFVRSLEIQRDAIERFKDFISKNSTALVQRDNVEQMVDIEESVGPSGTGSIKKFDDDEEEGEDEKDEKEDNDPKKKIFEKKVIKKDNKKKEESPSESESESDDEDDKKESMIDTSKKTTTSSTSSSTNKNTSSTNNKDSKQPSSPSTSSTTEKKVQPKSNDSKN